MSKFFRPLMAGAVALLLVVSASPAQAVNPSPSDEVAETVAPEETVTDDSAEGTETEEVPEETPAEPADEEAPVDDAEAPAEDSEPQVFAEAPEALTLSGSILVVPDEALEDGTGSGGGGVYLASVDGPLISADEIEGGLPEVPNAEYSATLELTEEVQQVVQEELSPEANVSELNAGEVIGVALEEVEATGVPLVVADVAVAEAPELNLAAPSTKTHTADVIFYSGGRNTSNITQLNTRVTEIGDYWNRQTAGKFKALTVDTTKSKVVASTSYNLCNQEALWEDAAARFGRTVNNYSNTSNARHLIVFVDSGSTGCAYAQGLASIGAFHQGGVVWVNVGGGLGGVSTNARKVLAHEVGHNLGLGHAQARACTGTRTDAGVKLAQDEQGGPYFRVYKPVSPCADVEYGNTWSVMGTGGNAKNKPTAVGVAQKHALGVLPSGSIKNISSKGGAEQWVTIQSAGADSGLRYVRAVDPQGGAVFVEYRNGSGQDSAEGLTQLNSIRDSPLIDGAFYGTGVQVEKSYPKGKALWTDGVWRDYDYKRSSVISYRKNGDMHYALKSGNTLTPFGSKVRVVTESANGSTARVRIEYKGFRDAGKSVSISVVQANTSYAVAGKTLKANLSGSWQVTFGGMPSKVHETYQWYRNSKPISGATKSTYRTVAADINKQITVRVKPSASGYVTGKGSTAISKKVTSPPFIDVLYGHKFYKEIGWMKSQGISTGVQTSTGPKYQPSSSVTREAMAAFLYRMEGASYRITVCPVTTL